MTEGQLTLEALIADILAGKYSLLDLIGSAKDGDYASHVQMQRLAFAVMSNRKVVGTLLEELKEKIAEVQGNDAGKDTINEELARKDGKRRFDKLIAQRVEAFSSAPSLLSGGDFESCLQQYKKLLSHVEQLWANAAQLYKLQNYPIAAFLSILVIEEIGKLAHLGQDLVRYDAPRVVDAEMTVDRNHRRKHFIGVMSGALINARLERILGKNVIRKLLHEAESDELEKVRQRCLYVDVKDGNPVIPNEQIDIEKARVLVVLSGELMAEVLGHYPWEFDRMMEAVTAFEREIGMPLHKIEWR